MRVFFLIANNYINIAKSMLIRFKNRLTFRTFTALIQTKLYKSNICQIQQF